MTVGIKLRKSLIIIFIHFLLFPYSAICDDKEVEVFTVDQVDMKCIEYPWANELYLFVSGKAIPILNEVYLSTSIHYSGCQVWSRSIEIKHDKKEEGYTYFQKQWGPINDPEREILSGNYEIRVEFSLYQQSQIFVNMWNSSDMKGSSQIYKKNIYLGTESKFKTEDEYLRGFYIGIMKNVDKIFNELVENNREAYNKRQNSFLEERVFSPKKWQIYLDSFLKRIEEADRKLKKHEKEFFSPRYPNTLISMQDYCEVLSRLGYLYTIDIYNFYKVPGSEALARKIDPFGLGIVDILSHIQRLHNKCAEELNINLQKDVGYIPYTGKK